MENELLKILDKEEKRLYSLIEPPNHNYTERESLKEKLYRIADNHPLPVAIASMFMSAFYFAIRNEKKEMEAEARVEKYARKFWMNISIKSATKELEDYAEKYAGRENTPYIPKNNIIN